jgi:hypothetical protein
VQNTNIQISLSQTFLKKLKIKIYTYNYIIFCMSLELGLSWMPLSCRPVLYCLQQPYYHLQDGSQSHSATQFLVSCDWWDILLVNHVLFKSSISTEVSVCGNHFTGQTVSFLSLFPAFSIPCYSNELPLTACSVLVQPLKQFILLSHRHQNLY